MVKDIVCVACPMGCQISVELNDDGEILSVTGNTCKRGDAYARTECTHPERSLTTTVKVSGGVHPVVPVKSAKAVPKDKVKDCVKEIAKLEIKAPVKIGDVVCANILGTGVDIVYPQENKNLYAQICEQGAVVSEFPLGTEPQAQNFPRRNRTNMQCKLRLTDCKL